MTKTPRVSVLMTVYNAAPWLREAVDSIVGQTYGDWEMVVIENGSSDESTAILASYNDRRIIVVAMRENIGRTPALRHAFELARGEYIAVLDADDVADTTRLEKQVAFLDEHRDVTVVGSWARRINGEGAEIGLWTQPTDPSALLDRLGYENPIVHSSAMYRSAAAAEVGGYPLDLAYAQDCGLWLRLAERGPTGIIGEYLCRHRIVGSSMTQSNKSRILIARDSVTLLAYAGEHLRLSTAARRRWREETAIAASRYAIALARAGQLTEAAGIVIAALARNPLAFLWNRVYSSWLGR